MGSAMVVACALVGDHRLMSHLAAVQHVSEDEVVKDLVASFLLPEVSRSDLRTQVCALPPELACMLVSSRKRQASGMWKPGHDCWCVQLKNDQSRLVAAAHEELLKAVAAEGLAVKAGTAAKGGKPAEEMPETEFEGSEGQAKTE